MWRKSWKRISFTPASFRQGLKNLFAILFGSIYPPVLLQKTIWLFGAFCFQSFRTEYKHKSLYQFLCVLLQGSFQPACAFVLKPLFTTLFLVLSIKSTDQEQPVEPSLFFQVLFVTFIIIYTRNFVPSSTRDKILSIKIKADRLKIPYI